MSSRDGGGSDDSNRNFCKGSCAHVFLSTIRKQDRAGACNTFKFWLLVRLFFLVVKERALLVWLSYFVPFFLVFRKTA